MEQDTSELINGRYLPYEKAKAYVHALKFKSTSDYIRWLHYGWGDTSNKPLYVNGRGLECPHFPSFLPRNPHIAYGKQFKTIREYAIGKRNRKPKTKGCVKHRSELWSYEKSAKFAQKYYFSSSSDYTAYINYTTKLPLGSPPYINNNNVKCPRRPKRLTRNPIYLFYKEWTNWTDYLHGSLIGDTLIQHNNQVYFRYDITVNYIRNCNFKTLKDYNEWVEHSVKNIKSKAMFTTSTGDKLLIKPVFIPRKPDQVYYKHWVSIYDYLNIEPPALDPEIQSIQTTIYRKDNHTPSKAGVHLRGTNKKMPYDEAREFVRGMRLISKREFLQYISAKPDKPFVNSNGNTLPLRHADLPIDPKKYYMYHGTWVSWSDFLGIPEPVNKHLIVAEHIKSTKYKHFKSGREWGRETGVTGAAAGSYARYADHHNIWEGWTAELNRSQSALCSYDDAKILLSFKNLKSPAHYARWYSENDNPFFLPFFTTRKGFYNKMPEDKTLEDFLSLDLIDKIETQKRALPVVVIILETGNEFSVDILKAGRFDACLKYRNKPNCYIFEMEHIDTFNQILRHHCQQISQSRYVANHLGMLYQDCYSNLKQINLASIYD